jgi:hypothetical protein
MSTGQPPSGPLKYKVASTDEPAAPKRVFLPPPPKKLRRGLWEALFRVVIALLILGSAGVAYWSFFLRLQPLQLESRAMLTKVSKMSEQADQAARHWTPDQIKDIRARYREVYGQLFADPRALQEWLRQIQTEAEPLALDLNVQFGPSAPQGAFTNNLAIIPASIALEVLPAPGEAKGKSPYERVLAFGQQLAAHGKRADLAELTVTGGPGSISRALLVFNLWAGDLGAEAAETAAATHTNANSIAK